MIFFIVVGFVLLVVAVSAHEIGHALAMRRYKIPIENITLFGVGPKLFSFKISFWKKFKNIPFLVRLLPIGASVEVTDEGQEELSNLLFVEKAHIHSAGIMVNYFLGFGFLAFVSFMEGGTLFSIVLFAALALFFLMTRYSFILVYLIGIATTIFILYRLFGHLDEFSQESGGIVSAGKLIIDQSVNLISTLKLAGLLNIAIGSINTIFLMPFDGGRLAVDFLQRIFNKKHGHTIENLYYITILIFIFILYFSVKGDLRIIFNW